MKVFKVYLQCGKELSVLAHKFQNYKDAFIHFFVDGKIIAQFPPTASVIEIESISNL